MSFYTCTIAGVPRSLKAESLRVTRVAASLWRLSCVIESEDGSYSPSMDDEIIITKGSETIFGGYINSIDLSGCDGNPGVPTSIGISANDYGVVGDRRLVNETIPAGTLHDAAVVLATYLPAGFALDPAMPPGPNIAEVDFPFTKLTDALNLLSDISGYPWKFDPATKYLSFYSPSAAPFNVIAGDGRAVGDIRSKPTRNDYYANNIIVVASNTQTVTTPFDALADGVATSWTTPLKADATYWPGVIVLAGVPVPIGPYEPALGAASFYALQWDPVTHTIYQRAGDPPLTAGTTLHLLYGAIGIFRAGMTDSFVGNGVLTTFTLSEQVVNHYGNVVHNGVAETLGTTGANWIYDPVAGTITYHAVIGGPATAVPNLDTVDITYDGIAPNLLAVSDAGEIAAHGQWDALVTINSNATTVDMLALAQAELARRKVLQRLVTYQTYETGLYPGMTQTLTQPTRGVSGTYIVLEVDIEDVGRADGLLLYTVTALGGTAIQPTWRDTVKQWSLVGGAAGEIRGTGAAASAVPGGMNQSVQVNALGAFYGDNYFLYDYVSRTLKLSPLMVDTGGIGGIFIETILNPTTAAGPRYGIYNYLEIPTGCTATFTTEQTPLFAQIRHKGSGDTNAILGADIEAQMQGSADINAVQGAYVEATHTGTGGVLNFIEGVKVRAEGASTISSPGISVMGLDIDVSANCASSAWGGLYGVLAECDGNLKTNIVLGGFFHVQGGSAENYGVLAYTRPNANGQLSYGGYFETEFTGTYTMVDAAIGLRGHVKANHHTAGEKAVALDAFAEAMQGSSLSEMTGLRVLNTRELASSFGASSVTTSYGIKVTAAGSGTTVWGLYSDSPIYAPSFGAAATPLDIGYFKQLAVGNNSPNLTRKVYSEDNLVSGALSTNDYYGLLSYNRVNPNADSNFTNVGAVFAEIVEGTHKSDVTQYGVIAKAASTTTATLAEEIGVEGQIQRSGGDTTSIVGVRSYFNLTGADITYAFGLRANSPTLAGGATITNNFALFVQDQVAAGAADTNHSFYMDHGSYGTTDYLYNGRYYQNLTLTDPSTINGVASTTQWISNLTLASDLGVYALAVQGVVNVTIDHDQTKGVNGISFGLNTSGTHNTTQELVGGYFALYPGGSATSSVLQSGLVGDFGNYGAGTVALGACVTAWGGSGSGSTTTNFYRFYVNTLYDLSGTIGTHVGVQIDDVTYSGATAWALRYSGPSSIVTGIDNLANLILGSYLEGKEITAPAAPAANGYRLYAEDNGAGKTRLMVKFNTGAAQQIAIQP